MSDVPYPRSQQGWWQRGWMVCLARVIAVVADARRAHAYRGSRWHGDPGWDSPPAPVVQRYPVVLTDSLFRQDRAMRDFGECCTFCGGRVIGGRVFLSDEFHEERLQILTERRHRSGVVVDRLTLDHWLPRAMGGGSHPQNLRPMCSQCNVFKGNHPPSEVGRLRREAGLPKAPGRRHRRPRATGRNGRARRVI